METKASLIESSGKNWQADVFVHWASGRGVVEMETKASLTESFGRTCLHKYFCNSSRASAQNIMEKM